MPAELVEVSSFGIPFAFDNSLMLLERDGTFLLELDFWQGELLFGEAHKGFGTEGLDRLERQVAELSGDFVLGGLNVDGQFDAGDLLG